MHPTADEAVIGTGCIGCTRVAEYVDTSFDSPMRGKGSIGGASLSLVASVIEETHSSPSGVGDWMPPYGYLHIVNLSRVAVVSVNSESTDECVIADYVVRTGCMSGDSSKLPDDDEWAAEA